MKKVIIDTEEKDTIKLSEIDNLSDKVLIAKLTYRNNENYFVRLCYQNHLSYRWQRISDGSCLCKEQLPNDNDFEDPGDAVRYILRKCNVSDLLVFPTINEAMRYAIEHDKQE